jgi:hypothetical protein
MTDQERAWRWLGDQIFRLALACYRRSGARITYTRTNPDGSTVTHERSTP